MFELLMKSWQWSLAPMGAPTKRRESWSLDRNWHRTEAERHLAQHNFAEAQRHLALAVEDADRRGASEKQRIRLKLALADAQRRTASTLDPEQARTALSAAESTAREAIALAAFASDREGYVNCLDLLADIFADQRAFPALEKIEEEAIRLGAMLDRPDPLLMAKRVHRLAVARHMNGRHEQSIPALEKSIQLHEQNFGTESLQLATLLHEAGTIYRAQREHSRAQDCFRRAMNIYIAHSGLESPEALASLQQLAGSLEECGDLDGAAALYERCLASKFQKIGVQHIEEVAVMQYSLANLHIGWGNLGRARELLSDCIGAFRRDGGARLAVAHETLAQIEERSGRYHGAIKELETAAKVWESCGKARQTELIRNLSYRADLLDQLRKTKEASWLRERIASLDSSGRAQTA